MRLFISRPKSQYLNALQKDTASIELSTPLFPPYKTDEGKNELKDSCVCSHVKTPRVGKTNQELPSLQVTTTCISISSSLQLLLSASWPARPRLTFPF